MTKTVVVASKNEVKISAIKTAFSSIFPETSFSFIGTDALSEVSEQPLSSAETRQGALNRVKNARAQRPDADYWMAIEGGADDMPNGSMFWVIWVAAQDRDGRHSENTCTRFEIPNAVAKLVRQRIPFNVADEMVLGKKETKEHVIGLLPESIFKRSDVYAQGAALCLIPLKHPDLYREKRESTQ